MKFFSLTLTLAFFLFASCSHRKEVPKEEPVKAVVKKPIKKPVKAPARVPVKAPVKKKVVETQEKKYAAKCYGNKIYMINDLGLTDEQTARIMKIDREYAKMYSLQKDRTAKIRAVHKAEIEAVLTKKQKARYRAVFLEVHGK